MDPKGTSSAGAKSSFSLAKVGHLENEENIVRIVHISDTHMKHNCFIPSIPDGDILIHSGDFINFKFCGGCFEYDMSCIDKFFAKLPHKHKVFVAGNHEQQLHLQYRSPEKIRDLLPNGIYLQDSCVKLEGIKIYGSPWNTAVGMAFHAENLKYFWNKIPTDVDILVTHNPPFGIKDFGYNKAWFDGYSEEWLCEFCTERNIKDSSGKAVPVYHGSYAHQGCMDLRKTIFERIRPKAHLFGHVHNHNGVYWEDGILFSNAAMMCDERPTVIEFHKPPKKFKNLFCLTLPNKNLLTK